MIRRICAILGTTVLLLAGCNRSESPAPARPSAATEAAADAQGHVAPTADTASANAAVAQGLPIADAQDFDDARRGLVASEPDLEIRDARGVVIRRPRDFEFVAGEAPPSVNPSLWRQAKLNGIHGLFEVAPGIYQVRGYDVSNMTWIRGASGWIVVDPLTATETAAAALALARKHLGDAPITALIFTHSHIDHFGGVAAVAPDPGSLRIVAPKGFLEEATSENVLAGVAMGRRATFMYGLPLARSRRGHVDTGLGIAPVRGDFGILPPTELVDRTPQELTIDGVRFVFQYAPHTEAPAELAFYLPDRKAYCSAELATRTLHNLYTLRGAKVRDALLWSGALDDATLRFGDAEVVFASHGWPTWGRERVADYLAKQRDVYKFIHDQTLRLANAGATPQEIADQLELPESLRSTFHVRGYYGTLRHDAKAVYQNYFGWYDGNPAHLDPLAPVDAARLYVDAMGGPAEVLRKGREAYARGEHRGAAMLLDHLVFADPGNADAREALARAYDQLGYRAESGPWRDVYLSGAYELRHGTQDAGASLASAAGLLAHLPPEQFFASMATRVNGPKADGRKLVLNFVFTDLGETHVLALENAVLHHRRRPEPDPGAAATVRLTRPFLIGLATGQVGLREAIFSDDLAVEGSRLELLSFFSLLDTPQPSFPIVTP
jgi:alkyl sulfatase BDS1-like metallo-beta-lactamase superfamily hydrolase